MPTPVVIANYDPEWPSQFEALRAVFADVLGDLVISIDHVGSTAVPGLAAKPIIDFDMAVADASQVPEAITRLATINYKHEGDLGIPGREAFRPPEDTVRHHPYLVVSGNEPHTRHITFRDRLRRDATARAEYETLKRQLAERHRDDPENYSYSKTEFVERILAEELGDAHRFGPPQDRRPGATDT